MIQGHKKASVPAKMLGQKPECFCGATLLDASASSQLVPKYKGFVNADLCVLPTQEIPPNRVPLFSSPSEAHSHLLRIPAHTNRRLSEMLIQKLLTLLHRFTT